VKYLEAIETMAQVLGKAEAVNEAGECRKRLRENNEKLAPFFNKAIICANNPSK
jgi:hypothetical protein